MKSLRTALALAFLGLLLAACSTGTTPEVASITISAASPSITVGATEQFSAVAKDRSGNTIANPNLQWHSSKPAVATIDGSGLAKGVSVGTTSITATSGSVSSNVFLLTVRSAQAGFTPTQTSQAVGQQGQAVNAVARGLAQSPAFTAISALPSGAPVLLSLQALLSPKAAAQALRTLAVHKLPRGIYQYEDGRWSNPDPSQNLELKWSYLDAQNNAHNADLVINWAVSSPTETVSDRMGNSDEVPTSMNVTLTVDGTDKLADIDVNASWYDAQACGGPILEPSSLAINGYIGDKSGKLSTDASLSVTDHSGTDDSIATKGTIAASAGLNSADLNWDVTANGTIYRDSNCFISGFKTTDGQVNVGLGSNVSGEKHGLALAFDFSNIVMSGGNLQSVDLTNGSLMVDNQVAVTFKGTLDDANGNGIPGDHVILTFKGGQTESLEYFLQNLGFMSLQGLSKILPF
jgi:hypothetical protein